MPGRFAEDYRGARFYKADLQMATPADAPRWRGPETMEDPEATAEAFVRRCAEVGLEVIGITDHNFASKEFIPYLRDAARRLEGSTGHRLTIFPGFEILANVGRGCHVLALFPPDYDLETIDHVLTQCGVPHPRFEGGSPRASTKNLAEILSGVQQRSEHGLRGLVVCPHSQAESGIFDTDRIADWLAQTEFTNEDLLAIEVPKPPQEMSVGWQRLLAAGEDCDPAWRRRRPIACLMSSDTKALTNAGGVENFVGFRYSWIKMSDPSLESLRQAFLDPESRIRLTDVNPDDAYGYPVVQRVQISGAPFLADQSLSFSPNMTVVIGGGGSGKSTVVEYMRAALGQDESIHGEARANHDRLRQTIGAQTRISITVDRDGSTWEISKAGRAVPEVRDGDPLPNIPKFLPTRFFSQREIYAIAESREARARLLDNLVQHELDEISRQADDIRTRVSELNAEINREPALTTRLSDLQTEHLDLETKLRHVSEGQEAITAWQEMRPQNVALEGVEAAMREVVAAIHRVRQEIDLGLAQGGEEPDELGHAHGVLLAALRESERILDRDLEAAAAGFEARAAEMLSAPDVAAWKERLEAAKNGYEDQLEALRAIGVDPELVRSYEASLQARTLEIAELEARLSRIADLRGQRHEQIERLHGLWQHESALREEKAAELNIAMPRPQGVEHGFVEVVVARFGDDSAFADGMEPYRRDGRRLSDEDWSALIAAAIASTAEGSSPVETWVRWHESLARGERPDEYPWETEDRRSGVLLEWFDPATRAELEVMRVPDKIAVRLYRRDGSLAGELESGLSVGQKCTAILAMLLAQDDVPAIIDQPEDELDNEFTFRDLVPMLRKIKEQRQLIIVTHDPNIPVNADAELVYALESRDGRGQPRRHAGALAIGALDMDSVRDAVEEIMEGSEDAFRRRQEKYGF